MSRGGIHEITAVLGCEPVAIKLDRLGFSFSTLREADHRGDNVQAGGTADGAEERRFYSRIQGVGHFFRFSPFPDALKAKGVVAIEQEPVDGGLLEAYRTCVFFFRFCGRASTLERSIVGELTPFAIETPRSHKKAAGILCAGQVLLQTRCVVGAKLGELVGGKVQEFTFSTVPTGARREKSTRNTGSGRHYSLTGISKMT